MREKPSRQSIVEQAEKLLGRKQLAKEEENWNQLTRAVAKVLRFA